MLNQVVIFKNVPEKCRDFCDYILYCGVVLGLMGLGLLCVFIKEGGGEIGNACVIAVLGFLSATAISSCALLAKANPLGRGLAWLVLPLFILAPLKFYRMAKALHSPEMNEYLNKTV